MKNIVLAISAFLLSTVASASYLESCDIRAKVVEIEVAADLDGTTSTYTRIVKIAIESALDQGSHAPDACGSKVGTDKWLVVKTNVLLTVGQELRLDYFYVNSLAPTGVINSERWTILN